MTRAVERLTTGVHGLADLLALTPPVLPTAASLSKSGLQIVDSTSSFTVRDEGPVPGGIWDDEEEKRFYEELVDLKQVVPSGLLGIKEEKATLKDDQKQPVEAVEKDEDKEIARLRDMEDIKRQLEALEHETEKPEELEEETALSRIASRASVVSAPLEEANLLEDDTEVPSTLATEDDGLQSGPAARLTALFAALPEANNREVVDKLAIEFAFLNSKAARKRLIKVCSDPHNHADISLTWPVYRCCTEKQDRLASSLRQIRGDGQCVYA
jgi:regulator of nonsense transcripts 2